MSRKIENKVIQKMMNRAILINQTCEGECRDFRIMTSPMRENTLLLRWTSIHITNPERPMQCFHYECFYLDGTPQNCSVNYSNPEEANAFFWGLETHYKQTFSTDHKNQ